MNKKFKEFISWAKDNGWDVIDKDKEEINLELSIISRYKEIPIEYQEFLKLVKHCISPSEKTWFICENEYNGDSDSEFKWNEFELLSLEVAKNDKEWELEISKWWEKHLPIVMSVDDIYSFYAIDLVEDTGAILKGYEPEFEEVEKVANNIEEFFELIMTNRIEMEHYK